MSRHNSLTSHLTVLAMANWYSDHPVVSTVLWLLGSDPELIESIDNNPKISSKSRTLSWKDEHDGPIAEYLGSPKTTTNVREKKSINYKEGVTLKKKNESDDTHFSRKQSLTMMPPNDSDVCSYPLQSSFSNKACYFRLIKIMITIVLWMTLMQRLRSGAGMYPPPRLKRCMGKGRDELISYGLLMY